MPIDRWTLRAKAVVLATGGAGEIYKPNGTTAATTGDGYTLGSTNPLECLNEEIARRTKMVSIIPNERSLLRLVGALLLEQNDERTVYPRVLHESDIARSDLRRRR